MRDMQYNKKIFRIMSVENRVDVLQSINHTIKTNVEIATELKINRGTVYNILMELIEYDLVSKQGNLYHVTSLGKTMIDMYLRAMDTIKNMVDEWYSETEPFYSHR